MAYPVATGSVLEVTLEYHFNGQLCMNVHHYYMQKSGGIEDGKAAALAVLNWWENAGGQLSAYQDVTTAAVTDMILYGQWITPVRHAYVQSAGGAVAGAGPAPGLPQNSQVAITQRGDVADRHNIGRKAVGAVPRAWEALGVLVPVGKGFYQDLADKLLQDHIGPEGEEYLPVIFNRQTPELSPQITETFVQDTLRVERRRTVGLGA